MMGLITLKGEEFVLQPSTVALPNALPNATTTLLSSTTSSRDAPATCSSVMMKEGHIDQLLNTFVSSCTPKQINAVYRFSGEDYTKIAACLVSVPTLQSIVSMIGSIFNHMPRVN